jgi:hypothetical protein
MTLKFEVSTTTDYTNYFRHGKPHRIDGPAIINQDGDRYWKQYGKLHRDNDRPAVTYSNGVQFWYKHSKHIKP